jgi:hypothetical protein
MLPLTGSCEVISNNSPVAYVCAYVYMCECLCGLEQGAMGYYFHGKSMKSQFADGVGLAVSFGIVSDDLEE